MAIKNRLKELVKDKAQREGKTKIPQREIAREAGVSLSTVHRYMKQRVKVPEPEVLGKFAEYLGIKNPYDLIVFQEDETEKELAARMPV